MTTFYEIHLLILMINICFGQILNPNLEPGGAKPLLGPCQACTIFANEFKKGMAKTIRGKHEGGDASWEAKNLENYLKSEIRLSEINEMACKHISKGQDQCFYYLGEHDTEIEDWWKNHQKAYPDFFDWFCINEVKVCCPNNHFGVKCEKCANCNGNGVCKGNGTRKGNGKCKCYEGYSGDLCDQCDQQFYEAFRDETKLLCSKCHKSCSDGCTGGGPNNCQNCKSGWLKNNNGGCIDINECLSKDSCETNKFCVNNEGSFSCLECDKSCIGCDGDGPDMCNKCAEGYQLRDGKCTDLSDEKRNQYITFTRYLTYLGLCIAICVIFQSSTWIASIVGVAVAIYISASEYWLHSSPGSLTPKLNTKQLEDMLKDTL